MTWQRKSLCESFWPETCRAQLRRAVSSIPHHHNPLFCPRSRIPARDGPTASSQALPVPWHMSCPWFPEPSKNKTRNTHTHFQLAKAPLLIFSLRPPQRLQSLFHNLTVPHPTPKGARGAREAKRLSPDGEETKFFILWQESGLLRKRNTNPEERGVRNKSEPRRDTGEGP